MRLISRRRKYAAAFIMEVKGKPQSDIDDYLNIARQGVIIHPDSDKS
jgi:hypothetical protein